MSEAPLFRIKQLARLPNIGNRFQGCKVRCASNHLIVAFTGCRRCKASDAQTYFCTSSARQQSRCGTLIHILHQRTLNCKIFNVKHSWPYGPPWCTKMTRRSPDERLRAAADCLSRLRDLGPDSMPIPHERHNLGDKPSPSYLKTGLVRV